IPRPPIARTRAEDDASYNVSRTRFQRDTLRLPWAVLNHFGIQGGLNIFLASEAPPGTGLGSSSTLTVALIKALATVLDRTLSRYDIAEIASRIELEKLGMPIGRQDQYAAAFGKLNMIYFDPAHED